MKHKIIVAVLMCGLLSGCREVTWEKAVYVDGQWHSEIVILPESYPLYEERHGEAVVYINGVKYINCPVRITRIK